MRGGYWRHENRDAQPALPETRGDTEEQAVTLDTVYT